MLVGFWVFAFPLVKLQITADDHLPSFNFLIEDCLVKAIFWCSKTRMQQPFLKMEIELIQYTETLLS